MKPKVVFFGNSRGAFGNRHFRALSESHCDIPAVVDTPPALRASTNPRKPGDPEAFTEVGPGDSAAPPGTVTRIGRTNCTAATGEGLLLLRKARLSGGPVKSMASLCRELGVDQGRRLSQA